ncbi:MAG: hypothetical protein M3Y81_13480 [Chloroflexota bacterium]|nr:hypothetical protein [Chloroflexota bacterium]
MSNRNHRPRLSIHARLFIISVCGAVLLFSASFLVPASALAYSMRGSSGPGLRVDAGFSTRYKNGNWVPVHIALSNDGPDFSGTVSINTTDGFPQFGPRGSSSPPSSYQQSITLASGAQKQITAYVPVYFGEHGVTVHLLDSSGHAIVSQNALLQPLISGATLIGVLADQNTGFGGLNSVQLPSPGNTVILEPLNASSMPAVAAVLRNFDLIILDNFTTGSLSREQISALQSWIDQGGTLIVAGGPEWQQTLSKLPAGLLPVSISGTGTLPAGTALLPVNGPAGASGNTRAPAPVAISLARALPGSETVLLAGATPLIVQRHYGQGTVSYLAFDPTLDPIAGWPGAATLWRALLLRAGGDPLIENSLAPQGNSPGQSPLSNTETLIQSLLPNTSPSPSLLLVLLLSYLIILGPVRLFVVRIVKRRDWSWRIALSAIVVFSLLSYGLALYQKGTSALSGSISVMQLGQNGAPAHMKTYVGVFVPSQGDFQIHMPGGPLVQPSPYDLAQGGPGSPGAQNTVVAPGSDGSDVDLQNVSIWTQNTLISEQDLQTQGGITSHLTLNTTQLQGTVTNTLSYGLSDVYVLLPGVSISLGHLAAGQTLQIDQPVQDGGATTLADQIATSSGVGVSYNPGNDNSLKTPLQRHVAILSTLSGEANAQYGPYNGSSCNGTTCPRSPMYNGISVGSVGAGSVIALNGGPAIGTGNSSDPLLLAGAPATLIGWADQASSAFNNVTVNGGTPAGFQEVLIQAPITLAYSGALNLGAGFSSGQLIDAQGTNLQVPAPGLYGLSTGSMTFEFALPSMPNVQMDGITIEVPSDITQVINASNNSSGGGMLSDGTHLQASLYNWQTGSWDTMSQPPTISPTNLRPYMSPEGRILLQLGNQDPTLGTVLFGKPLLGLQITAP